MGNAGMSRSFPCPTCGGHTDVVDSRPSRNVGGVRRRRVCSAEECGHRFTTMELTYAPGIGPDNNRKQVVISALDRLAQAIKAYIPSGEWDEL